MIGLSQGAAIACLRVFSVIGISMLVVSCSEEEQAATREPTPSIQRTIEAAPLLGQHTNDVLSRELGVSEFELRTLREKDVIA